MTQTLLMKIKPYFDEEKCQYLWRGISVSQVKAWEKLYPDVNVLNVLLIHIPRWLDKMEGKRITRKKDWKRTIVNWLKREQDKRAWENARRQV